MAAQNGSSIFPLTMPTTPIVSEFAQDNYVQMLELVASQCAPITGGSPTVASAVFSGSTSGTTTLQAPAVASGTVTLPAASGTVAVNSPAPIAVGASLAITAAMSNSPILLNTAAGSVATLPAATGSGNKFKFIVSATITSNSHKILAASGSDFITGIVCGYHTTTTTMFSSALATNHSIQMPSAGTQPSGGLVGDWFEAIDIAANLWEVTGMFNAGTSTTTPFSSSTS